jgi:hypothetical protein
VLQAAKIGRLIGSTRFVRLILVPEPGDVLCRTERLNDKPDIVLIQAPLLSLVTSGPRTFAGYFVARHRRAHGCSTCA